jgi:hypothetical protein
LILPFFLNEGENVTASPAFGNSSAAIEQEITEKQMT